MPEDASHEPDPPAGAPWDLPLSSCAFACIDCEMTGTDPDRDALVEVAAVRVENGVEVARFSSLVRTEVESDPSAFAAHGISAEALADAPPFEALAPALCEVLRGAVVVGHAPELDVLLLDRALALAGRDERLGPALDTLTLARRGVHARTYNLASLVARLSLGTFRWHRAEDDARATAALLQHLIALFRPTTARDLWEVRVGQHGAVRVRPAFAASFERAARSGRPLTMLVRTPGRDPFTLRGRVERWTSPHLLLAPGVRGRQGLRVLRADRVLRIDDE